MGIKDVIINKKKKGQTSDKKKNGDYFVNLLFLEKEPISKWKTKKD